MTPTESNDLGGGLLSIVGPSVERGAPRYGSLSTIRGQVMKLIAISREYGAGGREVAAGLSAALGWELLDHELLHRAAPLEHLADAELEALDEQAISLADRFRLHPPHQQSIHGLSDPARQAVAQRNVILVGRGSRPLAGETADAFHLRLVAPGDGLLRSWS